MNEAGSETQSARDEIRMAIAGMLFLSESEAALELLPPDDSLHDQDSVRRFLDAPATDADTFLESVLTPLDPADEGLQAYRRQWVDLFRLLKRHTADICVYRSGEGPVAIDIVAIMEGRALIVHTSATET